MTLNRLSFTVRPDHREEVVTGLRPDQQVEVSRRLSRMRPERGDLDLHRSSQPGGGHASKLDVCSARSSKPDDRKTRPPSFFSPSFSFLAILFWSLFLGLAGGAHPPVGWAQDSTQVLAEGRIFHSALGRLYHYRIVADSTVHIRQEKPPVDLSIILPASTLSSIFRRTEEQLLSSDQETEYLGIGYEDRSLVLRVSQQFDLYVLATLIIVVLVGGSVLAWLWWRLAKEQKRRRALAQSRRYLTEGREKERERLAQEIHDGPVQDLHGLHMQLQALSDAGTDRLQRMGDELMRVTSELRAMSADLHPPALQRFGLAAALRSHADRLQERHSPLDVTVDPASDERSIPEEHALPLFRIAQEAMNNAVQHGTAQHVSVQIRAEEDDLELEIQDDGDGFTPPDDWHALAEGDHYGLLGMRERAEAIGAELDIESAPGTGTRVHLRCTREEGVPNSGSPSPAASPSP